MELVVEDLHQCLKVLTPCDTLDLKLVNQRKDPTATPGQELGYTNPYITNHKSVYTKCPSEDRYKEHHAWIFVFD